MLAMLAIPIFVIGGTLALIIWGACESAADGGPWGERIAIWLIVAVPPLAMLICAACL